MSLPTRPLHRSTPEDARRHRLAWTVLPADLLTPVRAFRALRAAGHTAALLESVEGPARLARHSFVAVDPVARFRGGPGGSTLTTEAGTERLEGPVHEALRGVVRRHSTPPAPPGLPPLVGGWIGFLSSEWVSVLEPRVVRPEVDPFGAPDAAFDLFRDVVAFDHAHQRLFLVAACPGGEADLPAARERLERLAEDLGREPEREGGFRLLEAAPRAAMGEARYCAGVEELRRQIGRGEMFQAVLSQRFEQRFEGDPFTLYRVLRLVNPAPHMFFYEADGLTLVGSSPERLVSLRDGHCQAVPIAGTRPRGADEAEDDALAAELLADPKERAEHDMLVDLARNDLGRVARVGTVSLREHAVLERFPRVQHLVSRVEARLAAGRDGIDLLAATFPAGTVSGAPKVRALEHVTRLEGACRGPYGGAFGYLDGSGSLDLAITIRTLVVQDGTVHVQAGAGVVWDSVPEREHRETLHKARALFDAVELAASPAFQPADAAGDPLPEARATQGVNA